MFSSIWAKIVATMGIVMAGLLALLKFKSAKIEKLEKKVESHDKETEIRKSQNESKREVLTEEKKKVHEKSNAKIPINDDSGELDDYLDGL